MDLDWKHNENEYATHQPVLYESVIRTKGDIVEIGCGNHSTEFLNKIADGKRVYSIEDNLNWLNKFTHLSCDKHQFFKLNTWQQVVSKIKSLKNISVIFIDQQDWFSRRKCIQLLNKDAELLVIHDPERIKKYRLIDDYNEYFTFMKWYFPLKTQSDCCIGWEVPQTLLGSNSINVSDWEIDYASY